ncbi:hypothetical protein [Clostridium sp. B9]|uniref:hypothetical protein n=1 Tax=Clostridium sp. B9 TaxID=3423224 RepID=UPI003D2EFF75
MLIGHIEGMWYKVYRNKNKARYIKVKRIRAKRDICCDKSHLGRGKKNIKSG